MAGFADERDERYLRLLAEQFPTRRLAFTEVINLEAILGLPKGTEHFMSDIHGEYDAFSHILNNCSGVLRERVAEIFGGRLSRHGQDELCTLVYYPRRKMEMVDQAGEATSQWWHTTLMDLVELARTLAAGYTRSKVRRALPQEYAYIIDELMGAQDGEVRGRSSYHARIIDSIVDTGSAPDFVESLSALVKRLAVDQLHIVGDIFDRGPHADLIIDRLMDYHSVDIQWGNHDILWMGAAAGSTACQAAVVRNNLRHGALEILENAYGIALRELYLFAEHTYRTGDVMSCADKAISVILFKLEGQLFDRNPDFDMASRNLLGRVDVDGDCVHLDDGDHPLVTCDLPTIDPEDPCRLTEGELRVVDSIASAFAASERLHRHIDFLFDHGSIYKVQNGNVLFHACVPTTEDGSMMEIQAGGRPRHGRELMDWFARHARAAWVSGAQEDLDLMYYLWCGRYSPLSGRVMKTFERTFVDDRSTWEEPRDPYFDFTRDVEACRHILEEFGVDPDHGHIVNGHTPVHASSGESPVRSGGRLIVIDGGFCRAYHSTTGIAGYTLISDSSGMRIKAHRPFTSLEAVLDLNSDIMSETDRFVVEPTPVLVGDTDNGDQIRQRIADLRRLLDAFDTGLIKESTAS